MKIPTTRHFAFDGTNRREAPVAAAEGGSREAAADRSKDPCRED